MSRIHLAVQAYGAEEIRLQALYAAWSTLAWQGDVPLAVHVYTDEPASFAPLSDALETRALTRDVIRAWRGPCDFTHRLKAEMIRELAGRFPAERVLYLDADVFWVAPVRLVADRIGPRRAVLHEREYNVAESRTSQMRKFRRHLGRLTFRGAPVDLGGDMWNAGAVGMDAAEFGVVDDWIAFIDEIYPRYRRGLVEQYAIGLMLQRRATVSPCAAEVFHYWYQKDEYLAAIRSELEVLSREPREAALEHLRTHRIALPPRKTTRLTPAQRLQRALGRWAD